MKRRVQKPYRNGNPSMVVKICSKSRRCIGSSFLSAEGIQTQWLFKFFLSLREFLLRMVALLFVALASSFSIPAILAFKFFTSRAERTIWRTELILRSLKNICSVRQSPIPSAPSSRAFLHPPGYRIRSHLEFAKFVRPTHKLGKFSAQFRFNGRNLP